MNHPEESPYQPPNSNLDEPLLINTKSRWHLFMGAAFSSPLFFIGVVGLFEELGKRQTSLHSEFIYGLLLAIGFLACGVFVFRAALQTKVKIQASFSSELLRIILTSILCSALLAIAVVYSKYDPAEYVQNFQRALFINSLVCLLIISAVTIALSLYLLMMLSLIRWRFKKLLT